jgi:hypothetical protein
MAPGLSNISPMPLEPLLQRRSPKATFGILDLAIYSDSLHTDVRHIPIIAYRAPPVSVHRACGRIVDYGSTAGLHVMFVVCEEIRRWSGYRQGGQMTETKHGRGESPVRNRLLLLLRLQKLCKLVSLSRSI